MIERFQQALLNEGRDARPAAVKARLVTRATRMAALSVAIRMMGSDSVLRPVERRLASELADLFDIDSDTLADLIASLAP